MVGTIHSTAVRGAGVDGTEVEGDDGPATALEATTKACFVFVVE